MPHHPKVRVFASIALSAVLLASALATTVFARTNGTNTSATVAGKASAQSAHIQISNVHLVDMSQVPQATAAELAQQGGSMPYLTPNPKAYQQAQHTNRGSAAPHGAGITPITSTSHAATASLPSTFNKWQGQSDSAATCPYFGGCQPPDMGLAASPAGQVIQSVNTSLALYSITGALQSGWPKTATAFFGVPAITPSGCDATHGNIPFMSDPRSWYDPFDNRWGEAELQIEGAPGFGIAPNCTFLTRYWIATSTTPNPNGTWRVFSINMAFGSDANGGADFTQFGFNADGIYVSANMFNATTGAFDYAEIAGCGKKGLYGGVGFACNGWFALTATGPGGTVVLNTVQPAQEGLEADNAPHSEFFDTSFNFGDVFGDNCVTQVCHGAVVWSWSDPGNQTGSGGNQLSGVIIDTNGYIVAPAADEPTESTSGGTIGCTGGAGCIDAGDNRISSTPVYHAGHLFAAHVTGFVNASAQFVPAIQWWDFAVALTPGYPTKISGAADVQDGYLAASSNFTALTYPVMYTDLDNDIIMGYDYMGDTTFPSINFTSRRVTDPASVMTGGLGIIAVLGAHSFAGSRWGDYEAMSYTAPYQDFIWFSSQFANSSNDWTTEVMRFKLTMAG